VGARALPPKVSATTKAHVAKYSRHFSNTLPITHCSTVQVCIKLHDISHKISIFSQSNTPESTTRKRVTVRCMCVWAEPPLAFLSCDALHSADYVVAKCLSVRLSVCLSHAGSLSKRLLSAGSPDILVFPYQTGWQYSYGDLP